MPVPDRFSVPDRSRHSALPIQAIRAIRACPVLWNIQYPGNPQSFNRYSYVHNNPLSFTDPSGFDFFDDIGDFLGDVFGGIFDAVSELADWFANNIQLVAAIAVAATGQYWAPALLGTSGAGTAFASGFASGMISSNGNLQGSLIAGVTAVGFNQLHGWNVKDAGIGEQTLKAVAHGVVGGVSSVAQGGAFESGFLSAGVTQAFSSMGAFQKLGITDTPAGYGDYAKNATAAAIVGGTMSVIAGGDFANGAMTGAFSRLFNDVAMFGSPKQLAAFNGALSTMCSASATSCNRWNTIATDDRMMLTIVLDDGVAPLQGAYPDAANQYYLVLDATSSMNYLGGMIPTDAILNHEIGHVYSRVTDWNAFIERSLTSQRMWQDLEEKFDTTNYEWPYNQLIGAPLRQDHEKGTATWDH